MASPIPVIMCGRRPTHIAESMIAGLQPDIEGIIDHRQQTHYSVVPVLTCGSNPSNPLSS
jgi:hypothetical protein